MFHQQKLGLVTIYFRRLQQGNVWSDWECIAALQCVTMRLGLAYNPSQYATIPPKFIVYFKLNIWISFRCVIQWRSSGVTCYMQPRSTGGWKPMSLLCCNLRQRRHEHGGTKIINFLLFFLSIFSIVSQTLSNGLFGVWISVYLLEWRCQPYVIVAYFCILWWPLRIVMVCPYCDVLWQVATLRAQYCRRIVTGRDMAPIL